jgi:hypothetical protein
VATDSGRERDPVAVVLDDAGGREPGEVRRRQRRVDPTEVVGRSATRLRARDGGGERRDVGLAPGTVEGVDGVPSPGTAEELEQFVS